MTIDPKIGMWLSIIAAVVSALVLCGAEFTTIFGATGSDKILAGLGIVNAIINGANAVLHMIPSPSGPQSASLFPLGPPAPRPVVVPMQAKMPDTVKKVVVLFLAIGLSFVLAMPVYAQTNGVKATLHRIPEPAPRVGEGGDNFGNNPADNAGGVPLAGGSNIETFISNLADIDAAITLSTQIPSLQDPVGNACWTQFGGIRDLIKAHPLPLNLKVASDWEALRLLAIGMNQICANPNCGQMFVDATNAVGALAPIPLPISIQSICAKIPVVGTSAVPTSAIKAGGAGTIPSPSAPPPVKP